MLRALRFALIGSLILHLLALFGPALRWPLTQPTPPRLLAELRPLPSQPVAPALAAAPRQKPAKQRAPLRPPGASAAALGAQALAEGLAEEVPESNQAVPETVVEPVAVPPLPVVPVLASQGTMRYVVYRGTQRFEIGRAEQRWAFPGDGTYRLFSMTETSGLVSLFKPIRVEYESRGRFTADGLQPESFSTRRNGVETDELVRFDWSAGEVVFARDGTRYPLLPGSQDVLSLNYQLVYLGALESQSEVAVASGRKYGRYVLAAVGEEWVDTPMGSFRTLHLRATNDTVTEIWIALDHHRLPVKIRFTDKKGDVYEQVVTEMGREQPAPA